MIRGFDTLNRNIDILQKRQENISANMANVNTNGYLDKELFQSTLKSVGLHNYQAGANANQRHNIGQFTFGNQIDGSYINMAAGPLKETDQTNDFATNGTGFFTVRMANGQLGYTRNGQFTVNDNNQYVTQDGYQVLNQNNQPVQATKQVPKFKIVNLANPTTLTSQGNTYYTSTTAPTTINNAQITRGFVMQSNVSVADEMVALMQTGREYEANQKVLSATNETVNKAVNQLGTVQ